MAFSIRGFNDAWPQLRFNYGGAAVPGNCFTESAALRGNTIRFHVDWSKIQPTNQWEWYWNGYEGGDPNAHGYDYVCQQANAAGLSVILIVNGAPGWAQYPPEQVGGGFYPSEHHTVNYFGRLVVEAVKHYRTLVSLAAVEVWNEPNLFGPTYVPPGRYSKMLHQALNDLNSAVGQGYVAPVNVIGGSLAMPSNNGSGTYGWQTYMTQIDDQCYPWGLSIHPYCNSPATQAGTYYEIVTKIQNAINAPKSGNMANGGIWVTETGAPAWIGTGPQRDAMQAVGTYLAGRPEARCMLLHRLRDPNEIDWPNAGWNTGFNEYAVLEKNGNRRPIASHLAAGGIW